MLQYFVMTRTGHFKANLPTTNQCKVEGHDGYNFTIKLIVKGTKASLDDNNFIIDHEEINKFMQQSGLHGSCEQMHLAISKKLPNHLKKNGVKLLAYCCRIMPDHKLHEPKPAAFMEYMQIFNNEHIGLLPLLTM